MTTLLGKKIIIASFISAIALISLQISADEFSDDPVEKGMQIAERIKARDRGWNDTRWSDRLGFRP